jgi:hypothetical protein
VIPLNNSIPAPKFTSCKENAVQAKKISIAFTGSERSDQLKVQTNLKKFMIIESLSVF